MKFLGQNTEDRSELLGQVIDVFEDFLCEKNIKIFNPSLLPTVLS